MYADDLVGDSKEALQKQLDTLNNWCLNCQMKINIDKVKLCTLEKLQHPGTITFFKWEGILWIQYNAINI